MDMKSGTESRVALRAALRQTGRGAFTLIEVLLVVVIIGVLVGVAVPRLTGRVKQASIQAARQGIANIGTALDLYEVDNGAYPASLQDLLTAPSSAMNWRGPYFKDGKLPVDPWGIAFGYTPKETGYEVRSAGPNAVMGDGDDLTN
jgi:general secretion pathway protein G